MEGAGQHSSGRLLALSDTLLEAHHGVRALLHRPSASQADSGAAPTCSSAASCAPQSCAIISASSSSRLYSGHACCCSCAAKASGPRKLPALDTATAKLRHASARCCCCRGSGAASRAAAMACALGRRATTACSTAELADS